MKIQILPDGREAVLDRCGQTKPEPFLKIYPISKLKHCEKIGEGVYGEVFLLRDNDKNPTVMKIIPIEGDQIVNGERQKRFDEIYSEIVIAGELSELRSNKTNQTSCFNGLRRISCVKGRYPAQLITLWNDWDDLNNSENDSPDMFTDDQIYIVLELVHGGSDLEAFVFNSASQTFSMFKQVACALAVAENQFKFEHRDLHWGNVLLSKVPTKKKINFTLNGKTYHIPSQGIEVAIIDYTLSRIECNDQVIFNDLSKDEELFSADGDYQFEIYKLMQEANRNEWEHFEPYTNILWLHYLLDKCILGARYNVDRSTHRYLHQYNIDKLQLHKDKILNFKSATELIAATSCFRKFEILERL